MKKGEKFATYDKMPDESPLRNGDDAEAKELTDHMHSHDEGELDDDGAAAVAGGFPEYHQDPEIKPQIIQ